MKKILLTFIAAVLFITQITSNSILNALAENANAKNLETSEIDSNTQKNAENITVTLEFDDDQFMGYNLDREIIIEKGSKVDLSNYKVNYYSYSFDGWFKKDGNTVESKPFNYGETVITEDITLLAKTTRKEVVITYDPNGGYFPDEECLPTYSCSTGNVDGEQRINEISITHLASIPSITGPKTVKRFGFDFFRWANKDDQDFDFSNGYSVDQLVEARWNVTGKVWYFSDPVEFEITSSQEDWDNNVKFKNHPNYFNQMSMYRVDTSSEYADHFVPLPDMEPSKPGFNFKYWTDGKTDENDQSILLPFDFSLAFTRDSNRHGSVLGLFPVWEEITPTLKFITGPDVKWNDKDSSFIYDADDASYSKILNYGEITQAPQLPIQKGFIFKGWYEKDALEPFDFENTQIKEDIELYAKWGEPDSHTISFVLNNGISDPIQTEVKHKALLPMPDSPKKLGYDFRGWENEDGTLFNFDTMIIESFSLYARWVPIEYKVLFNSNYNRDTIENNTYVQNFVYDESIKLTENEFTNEGHIFTGWNTKANGSGTPFKDTQTVKNLSFTAAETITLYAQWEKIQLTVTANPGNGEALSTFLVDYDTTLDELDTPEKEGYLFAGWRKEDGEYYDFSSLVTEDFTITAKWIPIEYKVLFNSNINKDSDENETTTQDFKYDQAQKLSVNKFTNKGYIFTGWNTKSNGSGTSYENQQVVEKLSSNNKDTIVLYAQWQKIKHTVTFNPNNGEPITPIVVYYDDTVNEISSPTKKGYTFGGWILDNGKHYDFSNPVQASFTLTAKWIKKYYSVKYDANGGLGYISNQQFDYDELKALNANSFTKEGYEFTEWNTEANGTGTAYSNKQVVQNMTEDDAITLYAQWHEKTYIVIYDKNGGDNDAILPPQVFNYLDEAKLKMNIFTKTGYTFENWNTEADGSGTSYKQLETVKQLTNLPSITLYANWKANEYIINLDTDGGNTIDAIHATYDKNFDIESPTKKGYTFIAWKQEDGKVIPGKDIMNLITEGETTLTAIWASNTYTVHYDAQGGNEVPSMSVDYDNLIPLPTNKKIGHTFMGWSKTTNGPVIEMHDALNLVTEGDITLYAIWTKHTYTIEISRKDAHYQLNIADLNKYLESDDFEKAILEFLSANGFETDLDGLNTDKVVTINNLDALRNAQVGDIIEIELVILSDDEQVQHSRTITTEASLDVLIEIVETNELPTLPKDETEDNPLVCYHFYQRKMIKKNKKSLKKVQWMKTARYL